MKNSCKLLAALSCFFVLFACGGNAGRVEKIIENGVEIVVNHLEPYKFSDRNAFTLEKIFTIDTEQNDISSLGIGDILGFAVNPEGEIFCLKAQRGEGDFVFKFDPNGKFVRSFGSRGQGPGELQQPNSLYIDSRGNLVVVDNGRYPLSIFASDGSFARGDTITSDAWKVASGPGSTTLVLESTSNPDNGENQFSLKLLNRPSEIVTLDTYGFKFEREKFRVLEPVFCWSASSNHIFVFNEGKGSDIWVYDTSGKIVRKIRKQINNIPVTENDKAEMLRSMPEQMRSLAYFPKFYSPVRGLVAGEDGTLLVSTYEKSDRQGEFMFDIYNPAGVFVDRKSIGAVVWENHLWAHLSKDKLYCLKEKESGFRELIVSAI